MKRIAFYGGSFDPVHRGHLAIAHALIERFELDEFVFVPAFHAPHKMRKRPTSAYDRFAMLCLVTNDTDRIVVSKMEIEAPERPYTFETLTTLNQRLTDTRIFFVMGADSWMDIATWRRWEEVLKLTDHIVITRPGIEIGFDHVTDEIRERIVDLRQNGAEAAPSGEPQKRHSIYITDAVNMNISATEIRSKIRLGDASWQQDVPAEVAKYVEKYQIYS
jgi:nicotinate-nucleotide adenylyltransferase